MDENRKSCTELEKEKKTFPMVNLDSAAAVSVISSAPV